VIYDEIKKRHENFVMDQSISCSGRRVVELTSCHLIKTLAHFNTEIGRSGQTCSHGRDTTFDPTLLVPVDFGLRLKPL
jgi:hypothetical protein